MKHDLTPDATLEDVFSTLDKQEDYICGVLDNMYKCRKALGGADVIIGVTGSGKRPCYRIQHDGKVFDTFFDNHVSFSVEGSPVDGGVSWSTKSLSFEKVAALRGTIKR